jgi:hypothetical protein
MSDKSQIITDILNGDYDDYHSQIIEALKSRKDIVGQIKVGQFSVGDKVKFNDSIRPKYLQGLEVTATKVNRKTIECSFPDDPAYGRFSGAQFVKCPVNTLEAKNV